MTRRMFIMALPLLAAGCALRREDDGYWEDGDEWEEEEKPEISPEEERFRRWLRKKHRYRDFDTYEEAHEAYLKDIDAAEKRKKWIEYRKKLGITQ